MGDSYGIVRIANKYERLFDRDFQKVLDNRDFHIENLKAIIEQTKDALDLEAENMANWGENIEVVYSVDDADTLWKKFQLCLMKWYVNGMYDKAVRESKYLGQGKEKLERLLRRLVVMSAF